MITQLNDQLNTKAEEMKKIVNSITSYKVPEVEIAVSNKEISKSENDGLLKVGLVGGVVVGLGSLIHGNTMLGSVLCVVGVASGYMLYNKHAQSDTTNTTDTRNIDPVPFNNAKADLYRVLDTLNSTWTKLCETQEKEISDYCEHSSANTSAKTKVYDLMAMRQSLDLGSRLDYELSINKLRNLNDIAGLNAKLQEFQNSCLTEISRVVEKRKNMYDQIITLLEV